MRKLCVFLALAAAAVHAEDFRALVRIEAVDQGCREALERKQQGAPVGDLHIVQPYRFVASGIVISATGEIVTPAVHPRARLHIQVRFQDGPTQTAKLIGTDPRSNLALLQVPIAPEHFLDLRAADVAGEQSVTLVGHDRDSPVAGEGFVAFPRMPGVVLDHYHVNGGEPMRVDSMFGVASPLAGIHPGSACLDADGKVLGMTVGWMPAKKDAAGAPELATTFVMPSGRILRIVRDLRQYGRVIRAHYGTLLVPVPEALRAQLPSLPAAACAVIRVDPEGPAARGGLRANDVILAIDGEAPPDASYVGEVLTDKAPGEPVQLRIRRAGKELTLSVTPTEQK